MSVSINTHHHTPPQKESQMFGTRKQPTPVIVPATRPEHKPCGHSRHVGTCPSCQCSQLARWRQQLEQARRS